MTFMRTHSLRLAFLLVGLFVTFKASFLVYPDIAITYPFVSYDSFQWLADGLFYRGVNIEPTYRQIGLPAVVAILDAFRTLHLLPVITCGLFLVFMFAIVKLLRPTYSPVIVALVVLIVGFNYRLSSFFDYILADQWALTFMTLSLVALTNAIARPHYWQLCLAFAAISLLFQYAVIFSIPAYIVALVYALKEPNARANHIRHLSTGVMIAIFISAPPFIWKWFTKGSPFFSHVIQVPLVQPHFYSIVYYAFNFTAFLGIPATVLTIKGLHTFSRQSRILIAGFAGQILFWVFLYTWHDPRFILYMIPFAAFFIAHGIQLLGNSANWWNSACPKYYRAILATVGIPLVLSFGFFNTGNPLIQNILPITPQCAIELPMEPITKWEGNMTINLRTISLHYYTDCVPGFDAPIAYVSSRRRIPLDSRQKLSELMAIRNCLDSGQTTNCFSEDATIATDYFSAMRRNLTLRRQPQTPGPNIPILSTNIQTALSHRTLYKGKYYSLYINHMSTDDAHVPDVSPREP